MKKARRGFSLIEMLVVLAIFAIGFVLLIFDFRRVNAQDDLRQSAVTLLDTVRRVQAWSLGSRPCTDCAVPLTVPPQLGYGLKIRLFDGVNQPAMELIATHAAGREILATETYQGRTRVANIRRIIPVRTQADLTLNNQWVAEPVVIRYEPSNRLPIVYYPGTGESRGGTPDDATTLYVYLQNAQYDMCRRVVFHAAGTFGEAKVPCTCLSSADACP